METPKELTIEDMYLNEQEIWQDYNKTDSAIDYLPSDMKSGSLKGYHCAILNNGPAPSPLLNVNECTDKNYIPGKVFYAFNKESYLTAAQQAICVNALLLTQKAGYDPSKLKPKQKELVETASRYNHIVRQENGEFLNYVKKDWKKYRFKRHSLRPCFYSYGYNAWENKLAMAFSYPRYYKGVNILPLSYGENEPEVDVNFVKHVMNRGCVGQFTSPTLTSEYKLLSKDFPKVDHRIYGFQLPVSQDSAIRTIIKEEPVDVVISSSGLKHLMDDSNFDEDWTIPLIIKDIEIGNGKTKKVVYIDKALPKCLVTPTDFAHYDLKVLIRKQLCQSCKIVMSKEVQIENVNYKKMKNAPSLINKPKLVQKRRKSADVQISNDDQCNANDLPPPLPQTSNSFLDDLSKFKKLVREQKQSTNQSSKITTAIKRAASLPPSFLHNTDTDTGGKENTNDMNLNASYQIWNIKLRNEQNQLIKNKSSTKNLRILIRYKADGYQYIHGMSEPQMVTVVPKMEYQLEHGANIPTKKEINHQWTSLFFRPMSHLYRVRLNSTNFALVDVESVNLQKLNVEAITHYNSKPHLRLGLLHKIFSAVTDFSPGNYLLRHTKNNPTFAEILMKQSTVNLDESAVAELFDLHNTYKTLPKVQIKTERPWIPIDVNYVLPVHEAFKRMPGLFRPLVHTRIKNKESKLKNKNNKSKKKKGKAKKTKKGAQAKTTKNQVMISGI